ncbi:MAG: hypothetical protein F6K18_01315 [Okeania sp. SIO2C2]|uniref:hypothetical protein n=1 Tax=Okeania sp. SIO2C2 TaxID=2607787 RepID=UPI0013BB9DFC|nr:hypothetical protein [Okeania sp. SIO2C2]NEP85568.1 hypothetical protein [Okeania sp. SIO2C2]
MSTPFPIHGADFLGMVWLIFFELVVWIERAILMMSGVSLPVMSAGIRILWFSVAVYFFSYGERGDR